MNTNYAIKIIRIAAISGALAVGLGALGAHALKEQIAPHRLQYFEKAVQYQFVHTLALLAVASLMSKFGATRWLKWAAWAFIFGILGFSGSLYGLAIAEIAPMPVKILGPITPLGGLGFIAGWIFMFLATLKSDV
jgi:uncharacterized membrane protein YgdD (TMEM256/DUF423 family)